MTDACDHPCYTISSCRHDGTDVRHCVLCLVEFIAPCEPENYFHE